MSSEKVDASYKEEYTRQKTWSVAKKWHRKSHHSIEFDGDKKDGDKKVDKNVPPPPPAPSPVKLRSSQNYSQGKRKPVLFTGNDLLKQRRRLKRNGPIDLRDHLATLVDPDNVNYLVQNRNKEVSTDRNREKEMRKQLEVAKQQHMKRLGVGIKR